MAKEKLPRTDVTLGTVPGELVRFSYFNLITPRPDNFSKEVPAPLMYNAQLLVPKTNATDVKLVRDFVASMKKEVFTDKKKPVPANFWNPLRDGDTDTKENGDSYGPAAAGHYVLTVKADAEHAPKVVGTQKGEDGKLIRLTGGFKSGDYGRAGISLYGYEFKGKWGVGCGIRTAQLVQEGEALGSEADPDAEFGEFDNEGDVL